MAFQAMFPMATIGYILALPPGLIAKGHKILASQRDFHCASARAPPPPVRPPRSGFDGLTMELARCKVVIPSFLLVMLFLHAFHSWYAAIFEQYRSRFKPIQTATLDSLVSDVTFHNGFTVVDYKKKPPGSRVPVAASATANSNQKGKV